MADPNTGNPTGIAMNSLPMTVADRYKSQVLFWNTQLANLQALYEQLSQSTLEEYSLTSGDGQTRGKRKSLESVGKEMQYAENRLRFFEQKLYGRGLMVLRLRRK